MTWAGSWRRRDGRRPAARRAAVLGRLSLLRLDRLDPGAVRPPGARVLRPGGPGAPRGALSALRHVGIAQQAPGGPYGALDGRPAPWGRHGNIARPGPPEARWEHVSTAHRTGRRPPAPVTVHDHPFVAGVAGDDEHQGDAHVRRPPTIQPTTRRAAQDRTMAKEGVTPRSTCCGRGRLPVGPGAGSDGAPSGGPCRAVRQSHASQGGPCAPSRSPGPRRRPGRTEAPPRPGSQPEGAIALGRVAASQKALQKG